jgi:hypothetical protein
MLHCLTRPTKRLLLLLPNHILSPALLLALSLPDSRAPAFCASHSLAENHYPPPSPPIPESSCPHHRLFISTSLSGRTRYARLYLSALPCPPRRKSITVHIASQNPTAPLYHRLAEVDDRAPGTRWMYMQLPSYFESTPGLSNCRPPVTLKRIVSVPMSMCPRRLVR